MSTLTELRQKAVDLQSRATALQTQADNESRDFNDTEAREFDGILDQTSRVLVDIGRREKLEQFTQHLDAPAAPRITPAIQPTNNVPAPQRPTPTTNGSGARVEVVSPGLGTHGFQNMGEFAQAVRTACIGGRVDTRLLNSAGPPNAMTEGVNAEGGFAIPPDFRPDIQILIAGEDSLLPLTDNLTTAANAVTVPIDATTPWQSSGGIQAYWGAEAALKTSSKVALTQLICRLYKLYTLVPVSDELLEDAPALGALIRTKAPQKMNFQVNYAILQGNGTTQPAGILGSAATVTVPRKTAGQVSLEDVLAMWSAFYAPARRTGVWVTNQAVETKLMTLTMGTSGWPIYLPPGGLSQAPYSTLFGRPIIVSEAANDLGVKGDLFLIDPKSYLTATKASGIRQDVSIHLWFDWDVTCFRLVFRVGGCPWWSAPVVSKSGAISRSPFVVLDGTAPAVMETEGQPVHGGATTSANAGAATGETRKRMPMD